jgi:hypothetical protein
MNIEKCNNCRKTVYPADPKINFDGETYHKGCAKCFDCGCQLTLRNFARELVNGEKVLLCRAHLDARRIAGAGNSATVGTPMKGNMMELAEPDSSTKMSNFAVARAFQKVFGQKTEREEEEDVEGESETQSAKKRPRYDGPPRVGLTTTGFPLVQPDGSIIAAPGPKNWLTEDLDTIEKYNAAKNDAKLNEAREILTESAKKDFRLKPEHFKNLGLKKAGSVSLKLFLDADGVETQTDEVAEESATEMAETIAGEKKPVVETNDENDENVSENANKNMCNVSFDKAALTSINKVDSAPVPTAEEAEKVTMTTTPVKSLDKVPATEWLSALKVPAKGEL